MARTRHKKAASQAIRQAEVVAGGGEDGVDGVARAEPEIVAAHAVLGFEMADDGLDGGAAAQFALDLVGHAPFLSASKTQQPAPPTE